MNIKDLNIQFRYLSGNVACMSIDSTTGKPVHNDINNEDAIQIFNALIGSKENSIINEKKQLESNWKELKKYIDKQIIFYQNYRSDDEELMYYCANKYATFREIDEIIEELESGNNE